MVGVVAFALAGCGGGNSDSSGLIASRLHALSCSQSGFVIVNRLDNTKAVIYDCDFGNRAVCATYENGIVRNATAEVRLAFSNVVGDRPSCIS